MSLVFLSGFARPAMSSGTAVQSTLETMCDTLVTALPDSIADCRLAVFPFDDRTKGESPDLGRAIAEYVIACLSVQEIRLIERSELDSILSEQKRSLSDFFEDSTAIETGKLLSAQYIVLGRISDLFGRYMVTARIVNTATAEIVRGAKMTLPATSMQKFARNLLGERGQFTAVFFRSLLLPGWGQLYSEHPVRGVVWSTGAAVFIGYAIYAAFKANQALNARDDHFSFSKTKEFKDSLPKNDQLFHIWEEKYDSLKNEYSSAYDHAAAWTGVAIGWWLLNLADAAIAGIQTKRDFKLYFTSNSRSDINAGIVYTF